jgi:predicted ribosome quality control (RQC) complex YloA/Tae2 family protein
VEIELDTSKTAARNASGMFDRAKKLKEKAKKGREVLKKLEKELENTEVKPLKEKELIKVKKKREWYEKFRWLFSSTGKLIIGGRDATSNEVLMKKHTDDGEMTFHADIVGAPFFVVKGEADEAAVVEAVHAAGIFSKAWPEGLGGVRVFYAPRKQFTKQAPSGEFIGKGAFMVYGKKEWADAELKAAVGIRDGRVTCGPRSAIAEWAGAFVMIEPGNKKPGELVKAIARELDAEPEEVQRALPPGRSRIIKK